MMVATILTALALGISVYYSYIVFKELADVSQWVVQSERSKTMSSWYNRHKLVMKSACALVIGLAVWFSAANLIPTWLVASLAVLVVLFLFSGYINPAIMMRPRQSNGVFVDVEEGKQFVDADESVIVTVINGDARAHSDKQLLRPHVASDGLQGGKNAVMTYCGLTNLGMAFEAEIDGQPVKLRPITQLENNLVMVDEFTDEPVQQIWGKRECDVMKENSSGMKEIPTFRMPYARFVAAFPEGKVYVNDYLVPKMRVSFFKNPVKFVYDRAMELIFVTAVKVQRKSEKPVFPTIDVIDSRLASKEEVWGFHIEEDYVAYTEDFVKQQDGVVHTEVGGKSIVVSYDEQHESLGVFYNPENLLCKTVDVFGQTDSGEQLERVETVKAGAFWIVWANFFPQTDINRADLSRVQASAA